VSDRNGNRRGSGGASKGVRDATPTASPHAGSDPGIAVTALLDRYGDRIRALALRLCGHEADADDLVQEVFFQAFRKWRTFRGDADPGTWLYAIAVRASSKRWRKRGSTKETVPALARLLPWRETTVMAAVIEDDPKSIAERGEAIESVQRHIMELPEHLRLPLLLKEVLEVSVGEVAAALGLAENTVKTRLHRARLALRRQMTSKARAVAAPIPIYEKQVCLDLMKAKMEALDHGRPFAVPQAELCARCRAVFRELDLVQDACLQMADGEVPASLRQKIVEAIASGAVPTSRRLGRPPVGGLGPAQSAGK